MDGFYTVKEVCLKLHIARETLRRWEHDDWFPKRIRFRGTLGADGQHGILLPARGS
jgi:predicted DNA-binding transcriptional regulator AlpA